MYQNGSKRTDNRKRNNTNNRDFHNKPRFNKKENENRTPRSVDTNAINDIKDNIITVVKSGIDTAKFSYKVFISDKKVDKGLLAVTFKIQDRKSDANKTLIFVINTDIRSGMHNLTILSLSGAEAHILFSAAARDLSLKIEKYLPKIVESTIQIMNPDVKNDNEVTE